MNYYLVQTQYFLIFIIVGCLALSALPVLRHSFAQASDGYVQSQLKQIQGEMFFVSDFAHTCYVGPVGSLVTELYRDSKRKIMCRTNTPENSEILVCGELDGGAFHCIDGKGTSCEIAYEPASGYNCKDIR